MRILRGLSIVISFFLVAAHFLRAGNLFLTLLSLLFPLLLLVKYRVIKWIIAGGLVGALGVWINTFLYLKKLYGIHGISFYKPSLILGSVILFTFFTLLGVLIKD